MDIVITGLEAMTRPRENRVEITLRLKPEDKERLRELVTGLGYTYKRGDKVDPAWVEFFEAITKGEIILYKKVDLGVDFLK